MQVVPHEKQEFTVSVGQKGQITMPKAIRVKLGVKPKSKVTVRLEHGHITVKPVSATLDSIHQMAGALKRPLSDKKMSNTAWEEHTKEVAREGL